MSFFQTKTIVFRSLSYCLIASLLLPLLAPLPVQALSKTQKEIFDRKINYFDIDSCAPETSAAASGGSVYILGDSVTELANDSYQKKFISPWSVTARGLVSRHIASTPPTPSTLEQIEVDRPIIASARAIVIALGTNDYTNSSSVIKSDVDKVMSKLEDYTAPIYWVNTYVTGSETEANEANEAIKSALGDKAEIIDWFGSAKSSADVRSFSDKVHPTKPKDIDLLVDLVYKSTTKASGVLKSSSCACSNPGVVAGTLPNTVPEPHNGLFTAAANKYKVNPQYLAALFLNEQGNVWKPFNSAWASSPMGASGPFQFMPATWDAYKVDGNNDGNTDINNMHDAAYSAANFLKGLGVRDNTPLGEIGTPFKVGTFLYFSAAYNWGPGNIQTHTTSSSPITVAPIETQNYIKNTHELIKSGFTKSGNPGYGDPTPGGGGSPSPGGGSTPNAQAGCSASVQTGDIVQTALQYAWDTPGHGKEKTDAKPEYQEAMPKFNGSTGIDEWSDCGVFVATVLIASGADPDYPKRGTTIQQPYMDEHPEKYEKIGSPTSTSELKPGDILINSTHTYLYVGDQPKGYNSVSASLHGHVPQASNFYSGFTVYRLK